MQAVLHFEMPVILFGSGVTLVEDPDGGPLITRGANLFDGSVFDSKFEILLIVLF